MGEPDGKIPLEYRDQRPEREERNRKWRGIILGAILDAIRDLFLAAIGELIVLALTLVLAAVVAIVVLYVNSCSKHP